MPRAVRGFSGTIKSAFAAGSFRDGYASDMTRMVHGGPVTPKIQTRLPVRCSKRNSRQ
jgi:hypothetical protein